MRTASAARQIRFRPHVHRRLALARPSASPAPLPPAPSCAAGTGAWPSSSVHSDAGSDSDQAVAVQRLFGVAHVPASRHKLNRGCNLHRQQQARAGPGLSPIRVSLPSESLSGDRPGRAVPGQAGPGLDSDEQRQRGPRLGAGASAGEWEAVLASVERCGRCVTGGEAGRVLPALALVRCREGLGWGRDWGLVWGSGT